MMDTQLIHNFVNSTWVNLTIRSYQKTEIKSIEFEFENLNFKFDIMCDKLVVGLI